MDGKSLDSNVDERSVNELVEKVVDEESVDLIINEKSLDTTVEDKPLDENVNEKSLDTTGKEKPLDSDVNEQTTIDKTDTASTKSSAKSIVSVLIQYRHLLLFLRQHFQQELNHCLSNYKSEFNSNFNLCQKMFKELIQNNNENDYFDNDLIQFIKNKEKEYVDHNKLFLIDKEQNIKEFNTTKRFRKKTLITQARNIVLTNSTNKKNTAKENSVNKRKNKSPSTKNVKKKRLNPIKDDTDEDDEEDDDDDDDKDKQADASINEPIITLKYPLYDNDTDDDNPVDMFGIAIKYICSFGCRFRSTNQEKVRAHETLIHGGHVVNCKQKNCKGVFNSVYDLEKHMMEKHGIFKCSVENCGQQFENEFQLKKHVKNEHQQEYLTCRVCNIKFRNREGIRKHIYVKHETGDFHCDHEGCDYTAKYRRDLDNHKRVKHTLKKCSYENCGRLISRSYYSRHIRLHQKIRTYFCSWPDCGKSFTDNKSLKDHVRVHLNFKRYRCKWPECTYACEQQSNLITHIRVRHFKLPQTKKRQLELNISLDSFPNPHDFVEAVNEDICMSMAMRKVQQSSTCKKENS